MVESEAVEQPVDGKQTELCASLARLRERPLDGDRHISNPAGLSRRKRQHIGRSILTQVGGVQLPQLDVVGEPHRQAGASSYVQLVPGLAQQGPQSGCGHDPALGWRKRRTADERYPQRPLIPS